jgi:hypothetical protein
LSQRLLITVSHIKIEINYLKCKFGITYLQKTSAREKIFPGMGKNVGENRTETTA